MESRVKDYKWAVSVFSFIFLMWSIFLIWGEFFLLFVLAGSSTFIFVSGSHPLLSLHKPMLKSWIWCHLPCKFPPLFFDSGIQLVGSSDIWRSLLVWSQTFRSLWVCLQLLDLTRSLIWSALLKVNPSALSHLIAHNLLWCYPDRRYEILRLILLEVRLSLTGLTHTRPCVFVQLCSAMCLNFDSDFPARAFLPPSVRRKVKWLSELLVVVLIFVVVTFFGHSHFGRYLK